MRRTPLRTFLMLLTLFVSRDGLAWECRHRLLSEQELDSLVAVVQKTAGIAANPNSIRACRNWDVVEVETVRELQPDGTEKRSYLQCSATIKSHPDRWMCVDHPSLGFRADTYPGELGVWVALDDPKTKLVDARHDVAQAFALLARGGDIAVCGGASGGARPAAGLRAQITSGDGFLALRRSSDAFTLEGSYVVIEFEREKGGEPHLKCWYVPEIVVTGSAVAG